jgi:ATP-binding cassette subfamily B (MDR/TAP) protein 1
VGFLSSIKRCLHLSRRDWPFITVGLGASIITGGIVLAEAVVFGNLIQILNNIESPHTASDANRLCLIFLVLALVALLAYTISGTSFGIVSERLVWSTRDISLRTILQQDLEWFSQLGHSSYNLLATVNKDSGNLGGLSGVLIGTIFCVLTSMIGGIILSCTVAWKIAIVFLAAAPVMVLSGFLKIRILSNFEQRHDTAYNFATSLACEACSSISTVAALGREKEVLEEYRRQF